MAFDYDLIVIGGAAAAWPVRSGRLSTVPAPC